MRAISGYVIRLATTSHAGRPATSEQRKDTHAATNQNESGNMSYTHTSILEERDGVLSTKPNWVLIKVPLENR
jgi:hypothetical protein